MLGYQCHCDVRGWSIQALVIIRECHCANSWTKAKSIMHNRNIVTHGTVEVHLSLVCGKTLHPFKSRHYSWLFSFQVVHLYETPLISVLACSFMCCLPHKGFYQQILRGNAFQWCTVQHFGAAWSYGLGSPLAFAWLEADGSGGLWQLVSRWQAPGALSAPACCKAAKLSSSGPVLPWHSEDCSKSGKEVITL